MRVPLKLKNKDFTRRGFAKLGIIGYIPVAIRRHNDVTVFSALQQQKILSPNAKKKTLPMNYQNRELILRDFPELQATADRGVAIYVTEYDTTNPEHIKATEEFDAMREDLKFINFFDFDYTNEDGDTLWTGWGVEKDNYIEFAKKFKSINITTEEMKLFETEIIKISKGEETLAQLEINLCQSIMDMIDDLEKNINSDTDVVGVEELYDTLPEYAKDLITNYHKLEEIKAKVVDIKPKKNKKAKEVIVDEKESGAAE